MFGNSLSLGLAVGVLVGTTVLDQGIVNRLQDQTRDLSQRAAQLREDVEELQGTVTRYEEFVSDLLPGLISGRLDGREVVVVTHDGVDPAVSHRIRIGAFQELFPHVPPAPTS